MRSARRLSGRCRGSRADSSQRKVEREARPPEPRAGRRTSPPASETDGGRNRERRGKEGGAHAVERDARRRCTLFYITLHERTGPTRETGSHPRPRTPPEFKEPRRSVDDETVALARRRVPRSPSAAESVNLDVDE